PCRLVPRGDSLAEEILLPSRGGGRSHRCACRTMTQKILEPHEIQARPASEVSFIRLPQREAVFADRAARLEQLAAGHAMGDYLGFIAKIARAQDRALKEMPVVASPSSDQLSKAREH